MWGLTAVAVLLVAGECTKPGVRDATGRRVMGCSGTPDATDTARGAAVVATGFAMAAAGAAIHEGEKRPEKRKPAAARVGPFRTGYRPRVTLSPASDEPEAQMEPAAWP